MKTPKNQTLLFPIRASTRRGHVNWWRCLWALAFVVTGSTGFAALTAHYTLDESSGTTFNATVGPGGSLAGSGSTWVGGQFNNGLSFNGSGNGYVEDDTALEGNGGNNITVSFWMYSPSSVSQPGAVILQKGYAGGVTYGFRVSAAGTGIEFIRDRAQGGFYSTGGSILSDTWVNVVGVFNRNQPVADSTAGNQMQLFINGKSVGTRSSSGNLTNNTARLAIGAQDAGGDTFNQNFQGLMDDVGIWNECLTFRKIASLNGLGRFEGLNLGNAQIDQFVTAFDAQGSLTINGNNWQYVSGLGGSLGDIGGVTGVNAFVVLDASGNGMAVPEPSSLALGAIGGLVVLWSRRKSSGA